ncbi:DUF2887 domain-containing protein [Spirulina sp. CS-785/01]|nr:DUF2887 domain-containing protein [Spirulina sp. CS-785/01]MDB9313357.1 DUF2887 domain-containing protein [Spirulina sp. CS-785/01]
MRLSYPNPPKSPSLLELHPFKKNFDSPLQTHLPPAPLQRDIIDLIETIVIYKLPQASREEIAAMLGLTDLKQTRFYQDAFEEGREEERKNVLQNLLNRGNSPEEIAELVNLPLETVQQIVNELI